MNIALVFGKAVNTNGMTASSLPWSLLVRVKIYKVGTTSRHTSLLWRKWLASVTIVGNRALFQMCLFHSIPYAFTVKQSSSENTGEAALMVRNFQSWVDVYINSQATTKTLSSDKVINVWKKICSIPLRAWTLCDTALLSSEKNTVNPCTLWKILQGSEQSTVTFYPLCCITEGK